MKTEIKNSVIGILCFICGTFPVAASDFQYMANQPITVQYASASQKLPLGEVAKPANATKKNKIVLSALKGEAESFQLKLGSDLDSTDLIQEVYATNLVRLDTPLEIDKENIEISLVGYYEVEDQTIPTDFSVGRWPDVLFPIKNAKNLQYNTSLPKHAFTLWVTIYVPKNQPSRVYDGNIVIKVLKGGELQNISVPIRLQVRDHVLPDSANLRKNLFFLNEESIDLTYGFRTSPEEYSSYYAKKQYPNGQPDSRDMSLFIGDRIFPRMVKNKISPAYPVPIAGELYSLVHNYRTANPAPNRGRFKYFDGHDSGECTSIQLNLERARTVTMWVNPDVNDEFHRTLLTQYSRELNDNNEILQHGFKLWVHSDNSLKLTVYHGVTGTSQTDEVMSDFASIVGGGVNSGERQIGEWKHLSIVLNYPANNVKVYINGELIHVMHQANMSPATDWLYFGSDSVAERSVFRGGIDDIRVYQRNFHAPDALADRDSLIPLDSVLYHENFQIRGNTYPTTRSTYFQEWINFWSDNGLAVNQLPYSRGWLPNPGNHDSPESNRLASYFNMLHETMNDPSSGLLSNAAIAMPKDEAVLSNHVAVNRNFAHWFKSKIDPMRQQNIQIDTQITFGGHVNEESEAELMSTEYGDLIDTYSGVEGFLDPGTFVAATQGMADYISVRTSNGATFSPYIHRTTSTGRVGSEFDQFTSSLRLRGFFWTSLMQPKVFSPTYRTDSFTYWSVNQWDRATKKSNTDSSISGLTLRVSDDGRGYVHNFSPYSIGGANGNLFYPHPDAYSDGGRDQDVLDSVRVQIMRDGIEDYLYWFELAKMQNIDGVSDLLTEIDNVAREYYRATLTVDEFLFNYDALEMLREKMGLLLHNN